MHIKPQKNTKFEAIIGLEIHVQLATQSKIFSGASTAFGAEPNAQACAVDLGLPGVLPVLNEAAVALALRFGLAIGAKIKPINIFERKNYFYPDLPKGYQISQAEQPIIGPGSIKIQLPQAGTEDTITKTVRITRAHLEEDAGKSIHDEFSEQTAIDLNRAGTPLLEIVSEPELYSATEAVAYLKAIHTLVRYLKISDGNMAEGSMRCDANVSVRPVGQSELGTRCEIKNLNSFRFVEKSIDYEIDRQTALILDGGQVTQETRLYDAQKHETRSTRSKETANDYRYFPDPDLPPVHISEALLKKIAADLPELPKAKTERFIQVLGLNRYDAQVLTANPDLADFFEAALAENKAAKLTANWICSELLGALNKNDLNLASCPIDAEQLGKLIKRISDNTISGKIGKQIFDTLWQQPDKSVDQIIDEQGLKQVTDESQILELVSQVIAEHPAQVGQYKEAEPSKQKKLIGFFVGQIMKASKGKANPTQVNQLLSQQLKS